MSRTFTMDFRNSSLRKLLLAALWLSELVIAHGGMRIMGDIDAVNALTPKTNYFLRAAGSSSAKSDYRPVGDLTKRANMKCGVVEGKCPAGYW